MSALGASRLLPSTARVAAAFVPGFLATIVSFAATAGPAAAEDTCVACHSRHWSEDIRLPVTELRASVHGRHDLSCSTCHGGRPDVPTTEAHDPAAGFVPTPGPARSIEICGSCHADASRVPPGLRTDQLSLYGGSQHGNRLPDNQRVATCISCHGAHDVRHVRDRASPVHPDNVSDTCAGCHGNEETMEGSGLPTWQYRRWRRSVHGRAALDRTARHRPTCAACHTGHAVRRGMPSIDACGRCHEELAEAFRTGPHPEAFEDLGFNACVECHGNHQVQEADPELIGTRRDSSCRRCHSEGQVPFSLVSRAGRATAAAERDARLALRKIGSDGQARERVLAARRKLRLALHALDSDRIDATASELSAVARDAAANAGDTSLMATITALPPTWLVAAGLAALSLCGAGAWLIWRGRRR